VSSETTECGAVLAVSPSEWLARRIGRALEPEGHAVIYARDARELGRQRRERPFLLCFLDVRRCGGAGTWARRCHELRPMERYVWVVDSWQRTDGIKGCSRPYGYLREPFGPAEVQAWTSRAAEEDRLARGERSLEEHLYARFRHFLRDLGSQPGASLHDLVWQQLERPLIASVLEWSGGNQTRAAQILGIHRNTLRTKLRKLGLQPSRTRPPS